MACRIVGSGRTARFAATAFGFIGLLSATGSSSLAQAERDTDAARPQACAGDNGGITLPSGFCATVFADNIGHARQMAVAPNGVVYVNTWSGAYYRNDTPPPGGFLVALQDTNGDGRADVAVRFGETRDQGSAGGTGIAL
jgi:glucose/arabinose dehydrogenase